MKEKFILGLSSLLLVIPSVTKIESTPSPNVQAEALIEVVDDEYVFTDLGFMLKSEYKEKLDLSNQLLEDAKRKEEERLAKIKAEEEAKIKAEKEAKIKAEKEAKAAYSVPAQITSNSDGLSEQDVRITTYSTKDGTIMANGMVIARDLIQDPRGWYTDHNGFMVIAPAGRYNPFADDRFVYFRLSDPNDNNDYVLVELDGVNYKAKVYDVCGACTYDIDGNGIQRLDLLSWKKPALSSEYGQKVKFTYDKLLKRN